MSSGRFNNCKECHNARGRRWWAKNKDKGREYELRRLYGITPEQYEAMLSEQGGTCKICNGKGRRRLAVDHCHSTGAVRGLLCGSCNKALGLMKDDPDRLKAAIKYLEKER
jgi:hypothetical protein